MPTAPKGLAHGSRSADIGVGRPYNSSDLYCYGEAPGKSQSHPGPQQRIPQEYRGGKLNHCMWSQILLILLLNPLSFPLPRSSALSLITTHMFAVPKLETYSWASCMGIRWYYRSLLFSLLSQLARWRSRALMIPSILQQPFTSPALCSQSLSLLPTPWRILSMHFPLSSALGSSLALPSSWDSYLYPRWEDVRQVAGDCLSVCARILELNILGFSITS